MKNLIFILFFPTLVMANPHGRSAPALPLSTYNGACLDNCDAVDVNLCQSLIAEEKKCGMRPSAVECDAFVTTFTRAVFTNTSCVNSCDPKKTYELPMVRRCDDRETKKPKITARAAKLLSTLKFQKAQGLFNSERFKAATQSVPKK